MVKRKIIWSPDANLEFNNILEFYYKRNGNKTYSNKLYRKILKSIRLLTRQPFLGIQTDELNIRCILEGDYAVLYKLVEDSIHILSVWDCRQNPENQSIQK